MITRSAIVTRRKDLMRSAAALLTLCLTITMIVVSSATSLFLEKNRNQVKNRITEIKPEGFSYQNKMNALDQRRILERLKFEHIISEFFVSKEYAGYVMKNVLEAYPNARYVIYPCKPNDIWKQAVVCVVYDLLGDYRVPIGKTPDQIIERSNEVYVISEVFSSVPKAKEMKVILRSIGLNVKRSGQTLVIYK